MAPGRLEMQKKFGNRGFGADMPVISGKSNALQLLKRQLPVRGILK